MTLPWSKLPRSLAGDPRWLLLSPEGACAYLVARLHADDAGLLGSVGRRNALETLAAVLTARRAGDPTWARAAVDECCELGLLEVGDDGATLRVVDWIDAPARPDEGAQGAQADDRPSARTRPTGRPCKGSEPMSSRERKVRFLFGKRALAVFRHVEAGTTWEAWLAAHPVEGADLLRGGNETRERNSREGNETRPEGTKPGNETRARNSVGGRAGSETSGSSETQRDEKRREKNESPDARERERNSGTKLGNETPRGNETRPRNETPRGNENHPGNETPRASCSSLEDVVPFDTLDVLDRMRARSEGRLSTLHTAPIAAAFATLARGLIASGQTTVEGLIRAAGHVRHVEWLTKRRAALTLERLIASDGKLVLELLAGAATCAECGGAPLASPEVYEGDEPWLIEARAEYRRRYPIPRQGAH